MAGPKELVRNWTAILLALLAVSAVYLYSSPAPTIAYAAIVLAHAGVGLVVTVLILLRFRYSFGHWRFRSRFGWAFVLVGAALGIVLLFVGTAHEQWKWLYAHIILSGFGVTFVAAFKLRRRVHGALLRNAVLAFSFLIAIAVSASAYWLRTTRWLNANRIQNPVSAPLTMDGEGDGPEGAFFPSSAQVAGGGKIPAKFFLESQTCERCHQDVYKQWYSSAHHFSSLNNQWYRKSIEYMQDVVGTRPSKWCGGCHDPALLYSGMMDTPLKQIENRPEAQAGLGCVMCHSIAKVKSTMGQGDFVLEYPKLDELAASNNPVIRALHDFTIRLNPEPHRRVFLKPFMRTQTAEFCSSCHKVHLDGPVNHYRWIRGFDEYDNWQASGVSGQGARSFYYPAKSMQCADCHMPLVKSRDSGNVDGLIHAHNFAAANTALPTANEDAAQLKAVEAFLKDSVTVDIFAVSPDLPRTEPKPAVSGPELSTTFAVGEEAETNAIGATTGKSAPLTAPLDRVNAVVRRGDTVRVDVVVRTRRVGHFFPGGTVDAYDAWLELKAVDDEGKTIFWSGKVQDNGKGPVDPGAHFYRSLLIDGHGNPINKRNAWSARATVYVRLIPPGAADTVHYRLKIPNNAGTRISLQARLCYRKFSWWNTQFSFAGVPDPKQAGAEVTPEYDDTRYVFTGTDKSISGKPENVPDLPIIAISQAEASLNVAPRTSKPPHEQVILQPSDWTRWNDYGIGLLLQGDLLGARRAFEKVTEIDPSNVDGWVNLGRVAVQEGDMERARDVLERALKIQPGLARANFFYAKVMRNEGNYNEAAARLGAVLQQYPRDRVALNELGRVFFLQRNYESAIHEFQRVLAIDPEDLQANYNLMLCYRGIGQNGRADEHQKLYERFKADESSQMLTGEYRRLHPEDNNERQPIHEHVSVDLLKVSRSGASHPIATQKKQASVLQQTSVPGGQQ